MNLPSCDWSVYDVAWMAGPFDSDTSQSMFYDALDYCDLTEDTIDEVSWDNDCIDKGIRWSVVYKLGFSTCLVYTVALSAMLAGAWNLQSRMAGSCCFCLAQMLNFGALIAIGVFRFNPLGLLAAQSQAASKYDSSAVFDYDTFEDADDFLSSDRTYGTDANLITAMFIVMIMMCCCSCLCNGYLYGSKMPEGHQPVPQQDFDNG